MPCALHRLGTVLAAETPRRAGLPGPSRAAIELLRKRGRSAPGRGSSRPPRAVIGHLDQEPGRAGHVVDRERRAHGTERGGPCRQREVAAAERLCPRRAPGSRKPHAPRPRPRLWASAPPVPLTYPESPGGPLLPLLALLALNALGATRPALAAE